MSLHKGQKEKAADCGMSIHDMCAKSASFANKSSSARVGWLSLMRSDHGSHMHSGVWRISSIGSINPEPTYPRNCSEDIALHWTRRNGWGGVRRNAEGSFATMQSALSERAAMFSKH